MRGSIGAGEQGLGTSTGPLDIGLDLKFARLATSIRQRALETPPRREEAQQLAECPL